MRTELALTINGTEITAPGSIPEGGLDTAQGITQNVIMLLFIIAIILTLFFMIWGGIKWLTSQGDKTKVDSARKTIVYSIIGLVVVFLSYFIISIVTTFFGVPDVGVRSILN